MSAVTLSGERGLASIPGVARVEVLRGPDAPVDGPPELLVEVPHGADERAHFDALAAALRGPFPADLHEFFHANTDLGAWALGRRAAERVLERRPSTAALLVRCLLPRTFVDTNRRVDPSDDLASGGLTASIPAYVRDPGDRALLEERHAAYLALVERAFTAVCGAGGFGLVPHTYGPRTMGIDRVDEGIVEALRAAWAPARWASWPLRPEVDLIARDADGVDHLDPEVRRRLTEALEAAGSEVADSATYYLHPATTGARYATRYSGRVLTLEVRRDQLVDAFHLLEPRPLVPAKVARYAVPIGDAIAAALAGGD